MVVKIPSRTGGEFPLRGIPHLGALLWFALAGHSSPFLSLFQPKPGPHGPELHPVFWRDAASPAFARGPFEYVSAANVTAPEPRAVSPLLVPPRAPPALHRPGPRGPCPAGTNNVRIPRATPTRPGTGGLLRAGRWALPEEDLDGMPASSRSSWRRNIRMLLVSWLRAGHARWFCHLRRAGQHGRARGTVKARNSASTGVPSDVDVGMT